MITVISQLFKKLFESTGRSRILINSISNYIRYFILIICQLWMIPFLIRTLGDEMFGLWVLVWSQIGLLALAEFGLNTAQVRFVAKSIVGSKERLNLVSLFATLYKILSILSLLAILALVFFKSNGSSLNSLSMEQFLILTIGIRSLVVPLYFTCYRGVLYADQHIWLCSLIQTISTVFYTVSSTIVLYNTGKIEHLAYLNLLAAIVEYVLYFVVCVKVYSLPIRLKYTLSKSMTVFKFSVFAFIINVAGYVLFKLDPILINLYGSLKDIAIYAIALKVTENILFLIKQFVAVLSPVFVNLNSKDQLEELKALVLRSSVVLTAASALIIVPVIVGSEKLISLWVGEGFEPSGIILQTLCLSVLISTPQFICSTVLTMTSKEKLSAKLAICSVCLNVLLSLMLLPIFGFYGAAIGTLSSVFIIDGIWSPVLMCKHLEIPSDSYFFRIWGCLSIPIFTYFLLLSLAFRCDPLSVSFCVLTLASLALFITGIWTFALDRNLKSEILENFGRKNYVTN